MKFILIGALLPLAGLILGLLVLPILHHTQLKKYKLKLADFLPPFFIAAIQYMALGQLHQSVLEWLIFALLILALFLALFLTFKNHELLLPKYFKFFWRLTFLLSFFWYVLSLIAILILSLL